MALELARAVAGAYPHGAWLVELAPLTDPTLVLGAVAAALGVPEAPGRPQLQTMAEWLRPRAVVLVLDNCEHLLDACAALTEGLLRTAPCLTVVATSREPLGVAGETVWRVPPLDAPPGDGLPAERLTRYDAVRLFLERARAANAAFAVTEDNAAAVARVCRRLDGIPLALELAAARVGSLAVPQLAERLDDRFRLLTGGARTALPRQQTLRAAVDWSHDLLTASERVVLRRLSVFASGCTLEAAEAVCAGAPVSSAAVLDLVARLVAKSLVQLETGSGEARYRLLEIIRHYGRDQLAEAGEVAAAHARLLDWCLALARDAVQEDRTGTLRRPRLVAEQDHVRAALAWGLDAAPAAGLELAVFLADPWQWQGRHEEAVGWLERFLGRVPPGQPAGPAAAASTRLRARALYWFGRLVRELGETERARAPLAESLALFQDIGDGLGAGQALENLGLVARADGRPAAAGRRFEEALAAYTRAGRTDLAVGAQRSLGALWLALGDLDRAEAALTACVALARRTTERDDGVALVRLGVIARMRGDLPRARRLLEEALAHLRAAGFWWGAAAAIAALGDVALAAGDEAQAGAGYRQVVAEARAQGFGPGWELGFTGLGVLALHHGDHQRATRLLGALTPAVLTRLRIHMPYVVPDVEAGLAACQVALGNPAFEEAQRVARAAPLPELAAWALESPSRPPAARRRRASLGPTISGDGPPVPTWASPAACAAGLTPREWEVLAQLVGGASNRALAERLVISPHTAVRHVASVLAKLGVRTRAAAVARATGLDDP